MRLNAAEAITVTLCFLPRLLSPRGRTKLTPFAAAEARPATPDLLDRAVLRQDRTAIVLSLWAERPARQCVVTPRYAMAPGTADFSRVLELSAMPAEAEPPAGARALWARLQAAGISAAAPAEAASLAAPKSALRAA